MQKTLLFAINRDLRARLFTDADLARIGAWCHIAPASWPEQADHDYLVKQLVDVEMVVTSWGTAPFHAPVMAQAPSLRLMCHAAGSVKHMVSDALWKQARVTSAAAAIAPGVAEYCVGLMIMASKRVFWVVRNTREGRWGEGLSVFGPPFELYRQNVGIIGAGQVGRHVLRLLQNYDCQAVLYDPYCSTQDAEQLGARQVDSLDDLFSECAVVSVHAPTTEQTRGMLRGHHFTLLRDGAVFINTARSVLINEPEFIEELRKQRFVACIDVTDPEPPPVDHLFRHLPNVILTPHMAGAIAQNLYRIGNAVADEIEAYMQGQSLHHEVRRDQLDHMA